MVSAPLPISTRLPRPSVEESETIVSVRFVMSSVAPLLIVTGVVGGILLGRRPRRTPAPAAGVDDFEAADWPTSLVTTLTVAGWWRRKDCLSST